MKHLKRIISTVLVLMLAMAMFAPAFAAEDANTVTVTSKTAGHSFEAYQIFDGVYVPGEDGAAGQMTQVKWGSGISDETALLVALQANQNFANCTSAAAVAAKLTEIAADADAVDAFADIVAKHLNASNKVELSANKTTEEPIEEVKNDDGVYTYTATNVADGYYFIKETTPSNPQDAYSKFMLQVVSDVIVAAKAEVPTIDKKIVEGSDKKSVNNKSVGDTVNFEITSKVPAMDGYEKYFFVVTDTMSKGLTFTDDSVVVKIGNTNLVKDTDYTVKSEIDANGVTTVTIVFTNFIQYKGTEKVGKAISITYSATINENAVIGVEGNPNVVDLTYSNNPNVTPDPENSTDKPGDNDVVGKTPNSETRTYITGIELTKIDEHKNILTGAEFTISGTALNKIVVKEEVFELHVDGAEDEGDYAYWKLVDGTYTTTPPTIAEDGTDTQALYESITDKYKLVVNTVVKTSTANVSETVTVDSNGVLIFNGLAEGVYAITETKAPVGYNKLEDPIYIKITWTAPAADSDECTWSARYVKNAAGEDFDDYSSEIEAKNYALSLTDAGIFALDVVNKQGSVLPETGGIGTTIFYIVGSVLVLGAIVLLVTKRRMGANK